MIEEIHLNGLNNEPVKTSKKQPPMSINKDLPPCFFTSIFIGSKGSGKSYSLVKLFIHNVYLHLYALKKRRMLKKHLIHCLL
jgi:hypothetical protein